MTISSILSKVSRLDFTSIEEEPIMSGNQRHPSIAEVAEWGPYIPYNDDIFDVYLKFHTGTSNNNIISTFFDQLLEQNAEKYHNIPRYELTKKSSFLSSIASELSNFANNNQTKIVTYVTSVGFWFDITNNIKKLKPKIINQFKKFVLQLTQNGKINPPTPRLPSSRAVSKRKEIVENSDTNVIVPQYNNQADLSTKDIKGTIIRLINSEERKMKLKINNEIDLLFMRMRNEIYNLEATNALPSMRSEIYNSEATNELPSTSAYERSSTDKTNYQQKRKYHTLSDQSSLSTSGSVTKEMDLSSSQQCNDILHTYTDDCYEYNNTSSRLNENSEIGQDVRDSVLRAVRKVHDETSVQEPETTQSHLVASQLPMPVNNVKHELETLNNLCHLTTSRVLNII